MFSKHVGNKDSNEAEVLAILEPVRIFLSASNGNSVSGKWLSNVIEFFILFYG